MNLNASINNIAVPPAEDSIILLPLNELLVLQTLELQPGDYWFVAFSWAKAVLPVTLYASRYLPEKEMNK